MKKVINLFKKDFIRICHQHVAQIDNENQTFEVCFGEHSNCIQKGHPYLEIEIKSRKADNTIFIVATDNANKFIKIVYNAFAITIHDARISTTTGTISEQNKFVGPISTIKRLLTQRDGDLSANFDQNDESEDEINFSSLKQILITNHTEANRGVLGGIHL